MTNGRNAALVDFDDADTNGDAAYYLQRAEWHAHRAAVAKDDYTRSLHRKFAGLYEARSRA